MCIKYMLDCPWKTFDIPTVLVPFPFPKDHLIVPQKRNTQIKGRHESERR